MKKFYCLFLLIFVFTLHNSFGQGIDKPRYEIVTHRAGTYLGTINIELFPLVAPKAVRNFDSLVSIQFFDSTAFHRVVPGFVIQGGDPNSISGPISTWGNGQPWQVNVPAEFSVVRHVRSIIGAARDIDTNSANSQFYICVANAFSLDGQYTVFGHVTAGMDIVDTIVNSPRDANDVPLQKIEMFVTSTGVNDTIPDVPVLTFPVNNGQGILNGNTFQWSNVDGAVLYYIEISTDNLFNNIVFARNCGANSTPVTLLSPDSLYYWRVKSNNGGHESNYSAYGMFTTASAPQLLVPADNSTNVAINPVLHWSAVPAVNSYRLQVSTSTSFTAPSLVINQGGITVTSKQVNLSPNTLYYWRVTYISGGITGFYSNVFSFTTGTSVGINIPGQNDEVSFAKVYPNPASHFLNVSVSATRSINATITMKNILGEVVYTSQKQFDGRLNNFDIDVSSFSKGSYFIGLKTENGESFYKVEVN